VLVVAKPGSLRNAPDATLMSQQKNHARSLGRTHITIKQLAWATKLQQEGPEHMDQAWHTVLVLKLYGPAQVIDVPLFIVSLRAYDL
jgi:hypothetical protein